MDEDKAKALNHQAQLMHAFSKTRDYLASVIGCKSVGYTTKARIRKVHHHLCLWLNDFRTRTISDWWPLNTYSFKWTVNMMLTTLKSSAAQSEVPNLPYYVKLIESAMAGTLHFDESAMEEPQGVSVPDPTTTRLVTITSRHNTKFDDYVQGLEES